VMIDSLERCLPKAKLSRVLEELNLKPQSYAVVTLHRPSNVDDPFVLSEIVSALQELADTLPVIFSVHPRTRKRLNSHNHYSGAKGLRLVEPLGYLDFLKLTSDARLVITDSGGLQEETTYLGIPCITLRSNTERPVTIALGTNRLTDSRREVIMAAVRDAHTCPHVERQIPPLWDGRAAERILSIFRKNALEKANSASRELFSDFKHKLSSDYRPLANDH